MIRLFALASCFALVSCAGYQLQSDRPQALANIKSINVPLFTNKTLIPRGEAIATNSVIDAIASDGTYKIDTLRSEVMDNTIIISWKLCDARNPMKILAQGKATGASRFAIDSNLQTARTNALPDAMQRAATQIVGRLSDDF